MSLQLEPPVSQVKTEPLAVIKNEPPESEIGFEDNVDSSIKEIIPDIKNVDIVSNIMHEDSIKNETESKLSEFVETQVFIKTENAPFVKIENASFVKIENVNESEHLHKTEDTEQGVIEDQDSNEHFVESYRAHETTSWDEDKEKIKVIKAPVIPVEIHEYTSLSNDKHVCNHCQYACNRLNDLKVHITKLHREVTTMYQCSNCPFKSKWRSSLQNHIILKHKNTQDIQWFKCPLCKMKSKLKSHITRHMVVHLTHEEMQDKLTLCPVCGKGFSSKSKARRHVRFVHNKEPLKRLKCQECEYTTTGNQRLKHHIKTHHMNFEQRQTYESSPGDYKTKYKYQLESENEKHEKRYHCNKCSYKTNTQQTLKRHKLIHLKPDEIQYFYCHHCSFKSKLKQNLKTHISKHFKHEEVTFHCYICDFMTLKRELIVEHIEKHSTVQIKPEIKEENQHSSDAAAHLRLI